MLKRVLSISLALLLVICAFGVLAVGFSDVVDGFISLFFSGYGFNFLQNHMQNYHYEHTHIYYDGHYHSNQEYYEDWCYLEDGDVVYGTFSVEYEYFIDNILSPTMNLLKRPVICLLATTLYNFAEIFVKFAFAFVLLFFAVYIVTYGEGKIAKIARGISGALVVALLALFALGNVVMGLVESCVWIRTMFSLVKKGPMSTVGMDHVGYFITFNVLSISNYVIAILSIVAIIFIVLALLNLIKKKAAVSDIELNETAISEVEDKEETKAEEVKEEKVEEIKE